MRFLPGKCSPAKQRRAMLHALACAVSHATISVPRVVLQRVGTDAAMLVLLHAGTFALAVPRCVTTLAKPSVRT